MRIVFDFWKVQDLDEDTADIKEFDRKQLLQLQHDLKPHSKKSIIDALSRYGITVNDGKIKTLEQELSKVDEHSDAWEFLYALVSYLKHHFLQKNYLTCILQRSGEAIATITNQENYRAATIAALVLELVDDNGVIRMPNGQKLFHHEALWSCVIQSDFDRDFALQQHKGE